MEIQTSRSSTGWSISRYLQRMGRSGASQGSAQLNPLIYTGNTEHGNSPGGPDKSLRWKPADKAWLRRQLVALGSGEKKKEMYLDCWAKIVPELLPLKLSPKGEKQEVMNQSNVDRSKRLITCTPGSSTPARHWPNWAGLHELMSPVCKVQRALLSHEEWSARSMG